MENKQKAQELVEGGREHFRNERFLAAKEAFQEASEIDPQNSDAWNGLATVVCEMNDGKWTEEAAEYLVKAIKADSRNVKAWNNLADLHNSQGDFEQAVTYLEKTVELDPQNAIAHGNHGLALRNSARFEEAAQAFRTAIGLNPRCAWTSYQLGLTYALRGLHEKCDDDFATARDVFRWVKSNQNELENLPNEAELRLMDTYLTMKLNSAQLQGLLATEIPPRVRETATEEVATVN